MIELNRIVWSWDAIVAQLSEHDAVSGYVLQASCRPIAADRWADGTLELSIGCWYPYHLAQQSEIHRKAALEKMLGAILSERLKLDLVKWPGGMVAPDDPDYVASQKALAEVLGAARRDGAPKLPPAPYPTPPNPLAGLAGLTEEMREEARKCESALLRLFFARAFQRGIRLRCQYPVLNYRLDFAVPERRVGADVEGWSAPRKRGRRGGEREREQTLEAEGWLILRFSGRDVHRDLEACVDELARELARRPTYRPGEGPRRPAR